MVWIAEPESAQNPVCELLPTLLADCLGETPTVEELRQGTIPYRCVIFREVFVLDVLAKLPPEYPWLISEGFFACMD